MIIYTEEDFKIAQFARHSSSSMLATRDAYHYKFSRGEWQDTDGDAFTDAEMARDGWIPVHEGKSPDDWADLVGRAIESAEKAEASLAEFQAMHARQIETIARLQENPRPLTADDITNDQRDRARAELRQFIAEGGQVEASEGARVRAVDIVLAAALTEPPFRPDGAVELEEAMKDFDDYFEAYGFAGLADHLAERGFQFVEDYSLYCGKGPCALENGHDGKCRC